ncbi:hypothetical protein HMPREF9530_03161 [Escherichia coli MS 21-1]|nr:hypothetical protein HMPREF9530_03161 [Escherichia coli MS 21-1]KXL24301.1 hypothetical protein AXH14_05485 [Escherichia coli]
MSHPLINNHRLPFAAICSNNQESEILAMWLTNFRIRVDMYYQKVELIRHLIRCNATAAVWLFIRIPKQLQGSASLCCGTHYVKEEKSWNRPGAGTAQTIRFL